jgi:hypothetical protein
LVPRLGNDDTGDFVSSKERCHGTGTKNALGSSNHMAATAPHLTLFEVSGGQLVFIPPVFRPVLPKKI